MKKFLMSLSLLFIFLCFPGPMMSLLMLLTTLEMEVRFNAPWSYLFAGVLWVFTMYGILTDYWKSTSPRFVGRLWVVDERYLEECDGIPYYEAPDKIASVQKPLIVQEIENENSNVRTSVLRGTLPGSGNGFV